eukprot:CAMPEP_0116003642 /NCGR_PEP_ID=MMETSP0321-20121206/163_1 /TAXON_ID=163516 /ORGANISM="Leptocylindrus danicus var. danicus, Strain B650" /LENGTH=292 /DNA_ID=CAMNT_0003471861 /DNA_START=161 /DNA_END=1039 /DNA_ORIENTATION=-
MEYSKCWNVPTRPRTLPPYYPLAYYGSVFVPEVGDAQIIADRITSLLLDRYSICVVKNNDICDGSVARAWFKHDQNMLEFQVQLFSFVENDNAGTCGVIVELIRRRGCVHEFHRLRNEILRMAKGLSSDHDLNKEDLSMILKEDSDGEPLYSDILNLLSHHKSDAGRFGLESIMSLVHTNSMEDYWCEYDYENSGQHLKRSGSGLLNPRRKDELHDMMMIASGDHAYYTPQSTARYKMATKMSRRDDASFHRRRQKYESRLNMFGTKKGDSRRRRSDSFTRMPNRCKMNFFK